MSAPESVLQMEAGHRYRQSQAWGLCASCGQRWKDHQPLRPRLPRRRPRTPLQYEAERRAVRLGGETGPLLTHSAPKANRTHRHRWQGRGWTKGRDVAMRRRQAIEREATRAALVEVRERIVGRKELICDCRLSAAECPRVQAILDELGA